MNALSYVASDAYVQIAFLAAIVAIIAMLIAASSRRRHETIDMRRDEFRHRSTIEMKRLDRELGAIDGKRLPSPAEND